MKNETIVGFIISVLTLALSTLESSAELLGISQNAILIAGLIIGFLSSVWEMFKRLPVDKAKNFAEFYSKGDLDVLSRRHSEDVDVAYNKWKAYR